MELNYSNIEHVARDYVKNLSEMMEPLRSKVQINRDFYRLMWFLKREPIGVGPYPNVSLFESCNRIFSDLVVLFGVRRLLIELRDKFPFTEFIVALGTEHGSDVSARGLRSSLVGEAFSVAPTFFPTKEREARRKLVAADAEYKIMLFNSDAVANPSLWDLKENGEILYLTINAEQCLTGLT